MKKYLWSLLAFGNLAWAQNSDWTEVQLPVVCGPFREIVETLMKNQYREVPLWIGKSSEDASQFVVFRNEKTGAWTLVQYGSVNGCILGIGNQSDIFLGNFTIKSNKF